MANAVDGSASLSDDGDGDSTIDCTGEGVGGHNAEGEVRKFKRRDCVDQIAGDTLRKGRAENGFSSGRDAFINKGVRGTIVGHEPLEVCVERAVTRVVNLLTVRAGSVGGLKEDSSITLGNDGSCDSVTAVEAGEGN